MTTMKVEQEKVPMSVKILGSVLKFMDPIIYRKDMTVNRKLQSYLDPTTAASLKPREGVSSKDVVIDVPNKVWVRVFKLEDQDSQTKLPLMIYYHGGGFVGLGADTTAYDTMCRKTAKACNAAVVSVNYRRAPEHPYPAVYDDCYNVFSWLRSSESSEHLPAGVDLSQCFLMGDSAGGNIVHFMGCRAAENENDLSPIKIRGMVELQPFFGGEELTPSEINIKPPILSLATAHWAWKAFLPGENRDHPACNVTGPNAPDISHLHLPPILVIIGTVDILIDRQEAYVDKLKDMGVDVTVKKYGGCCHAFYIFSNDLTNKIMAEVFEFINSHKIQ
ncbi:unnamed protein product [Calypogeia fissa]